ncbi:MAG: DMT family transporter [Leptospirillia bacterium]
MSVTLVGLLFGALASLCWGIADFVARGVTRRVGGNYTLFMVLAGGGVGVTLYAVPRGLTPVTGSGQVLILVTALLALLGYMALYRAFKVGMLSVVSPIAAANAVIPVTLALIVLGERPLPWQYGGIVMVLTGVVLLSLQGGVPMPDHTRELGVTPAVICMVLFGLSLFGMKLAVEAASPETVAFSVRMIGIVVLGLVLIARGEMRMPPPEVRAPLLLAGLLDAAAFVFFCEALTRTLLSLVAPISSTIPLVTVTLAWIYLHERLSRPQQIGLVLAVTGIGLVAIS